MAKKSMALARRPKARVRKLEADVRRLAMVKGTNKPAPLERRLTDDPDLGAVGLVEVKLTAQEATILATPIPVDRVKVIPDTKGEPIYIAHGDYRKLFNEAFGVLGWSIVPCGKPSLIDGKTVQVPYIMHIHAKPALFVWGTADHQATNKQINLGDALESTSASAIRRFAKQLGVWLELWDRDWIQNYLAKRPSRRRDERPRQDYVDADVVPDHREEPARSSSSSTEPITEPQQKRLYAICKNAARLNADVSAWLKRRYGFSSSKEITRDKYQEICTLLESTKSLEG